MNICICGALGRMGKAVYNNSLKFEDVSIVCGVDAFVTENPMPYPIYKTFDEVKEKVDVIIDFSSPMVLDSELDYAIRNNVGLILCTTGLNEEQLKKADDASKKIALFRSANMSIGVNILINLVKKATEAIPDFDIEIIEKHHNQKVDSPSGTALMLADSIKEVRPNAKYVFGRSGMSKREKNEIGIHALRMANIVGVHEVYITTDTEQIMLKHTAFDRALFADGAIKAAEYLVGKEAGIYTMKNIFND